MREQTAVRDRLGPAAESAIRAPPGFTQMLVVRCLAAHDWLSRFRRAQSPLFHVKHPA